MKSGMNKRILFLLLECIAITISLMLTSAAMTEGHDGHYNYTVSNGEIRIYSVAPNISGELVVPESIAGYPVTTIGTFAFNRLTNVTSIHLPSSLTTIENYAFMGCSSLESITIPDHVKTLGEATFQNCTALKSFTLSDSITEIPLETFSGCTSLESIIIPENIQAIGIGAFYNCTSAREIYIPTSVTSISLGAFAGCSAVEKITLPFVGESADDDPSRVFSDPFGGSNVYSVPQSLKEVTILGGNIIPEGAFEDCAYIEKIYISEEISHIEDQAFYRCPSLKEIVVAKGSSFYQSIGNCLIERATKRLILGCQTSVIPDDGTVTIIGSYAFGGCFNLDKITVPNSVTKIELSAFDGCTGLREISLPFVGEQASLTSHRNFGYIFGARSSTSHNTVTIPQGLKTVTITGDCIIASDAFSHCRKITSFTARANVKSIGLFAFFECTGLETVHFEGELEKIDQSAFLNCTSLKEILLPHSVKEINHLAFEACPVLKILCTEDSVAQQHAIKYGIAYEIVEIPSEGTTPEPPPPSEAKPAEPSGKGMRAAIGIGASVAVAVLLGGIAIVLYKKRSTARR